MVPAVLRGASGYRKFILPKCQECGRDVLFTCSVELKQRSGWSFCCLQRRELWHRKDSSWCDFLLHSFGWFPLSSDPDWEIISGGFYSLEIKYSPPYEWIIHPELLTFYSNWGGGLSLTYSVATRHVTHLIIHTHLLTSWIQSQWFHLFCWLPFVNIPAPCRFPPHPNSRLLLLPFPTHHLHTSSASPAWFWFHLFPHSSSAGIRRGPAGDLRTFYRWEPPTPRWVGRPSFQHILDLALSGMAPMVTSLWPMRVKAQAGRFDQASPRLINTLPSRARLLIPSPLFILSFYSFTPQQWTWRVFAIWQLIKW